MIVPENSSSSAADTQETCSLCDQQMHVRHNRSETQPLCAAHTHVMNSNLFKSYRQYGLSVQRPLLQKQLLSKTETFTSYQICTKSTLASKNYLLTFIDHQRWTWPLTYFHLVCLKIPLSLQITTSIVSQKVRGQTETVKLSGGTNQLIMVPFVYRPFSNMLECWDATCTDLIIVNWRQLLKCTSLPPMRPIRCLSIFGTRLSNTGGTNLLPVKSPMGRPTVTAFPRGFGTVTFAHCPRSSALFQRMQCFEYWLRERSCIDYSLGSSGWFALRTESSRPAAGLTGGIAKPQHNMRSHSLPTNIRSSPSWVTGFLFDTHVIRGMNNIFRRNDAHYGINIPVHGCERSCI